MSATIRGLLLVAAAVTLDLLFWDGEVELPGGGGLPLWLPVVATVAAHSALLWRRTRPRAVFAVQAGFAMVSILVPLWQPIAGLLVATFALAAHTAVRTARWGWLVAVPLLTHSVAQWAWLDSKWIGLAQGSLLYLAVGAAAWFAGRHAHARRERLRAWQADQERLREEATHNERVLLARELHDGVANTITTVLLQAAAARAASAGDPAALRGIEGAARHAMEEIQATLRMMPRDRLMADAPLLTDLPALLALASEAGLDVSFTETGRRRDLPPAAQTAVYRAVQEGVTNALKYAPPGTPCRVALAWRDTELEVAVVDSPGHVVGAPPQLPATGGRGLDGLRDRLRTIGGALESGTHEDGFRLAARVPVGVR